VAAGSEQLRWEAKWATPAALAALGYALLSVAGNVYVAAGLENRPEPGDTVDFMRALDAESGVFVTSAVVQSIALAVLAPALVYLYGVVKARRPETPTIALYLAVGGPLLLAVAGVLSQLDRIDNAEQFFASGRRTEDRADDLLVERSGLGLGFGLAGSLAFGFALILLNVNAMRAGIESRFMGVIGVIVGALPVLSSLLPIASAGFIQLFWVIALGALFLGKWPGGRGPAWETGEAIPWPSGGERRKEAAEAQAPPAGDLPPADDEDAGDAPSATKRRKKKRKR
jgi:hypothetical protein